MQLACLAEAVAFAAPAADPLPTGNEIIITGERTPRSLKDTPSSVVVFGKEDIAQLAEPDRVQQLLQFIPNLQVGSSRETPAIRGQESIGVLQGLHGFLGGARPRTTVQIDGRAIGYHEFAFGVAGLWDVDRVEVFRSPQTTTQGPNAIAGAIFLHTADPTYRFEGRGRLIAGDWRTRQASAVVSAPLIGNQFAMRVSGDLRRSRTSSKLSGPVDGVNLNHDRYGTLRAKLLAEPQAVPGLRLLLTYAHSQSAAPQTETARRPYRKRRDDAVLYGFYKIDVDTLTGAITFPITHTLGSRTVLSGGDMRVRRFAPRGFGESRTHGTDRSFESVFEWKPDAPVSLVAGIHVLAIDLDQDIDLSATPIGTGEFRDRQRSRGLFADISWHPAPGLTVAGGVRYQSDGKRRIGLLKAGADLPLDYDETVHALLPKLSVAFDLRRNLRVGAMIQRAYNPGGVTLDPVRRRQVAFQPEYLTDIELFARANPSGGALSVDARLFYNAIEDAQRQLDVPFDTPAGSVGLSQISNAPAARAYGIELQLDYKASPRLALRGSAGLLATKLTKTLLPDDPVLGKRFSRSPAFTGAAGIDWKPIPAVGVSAQVRHNSSYFGDDAETAVLRVRGSTTVDAKVSWRLRNFTAFGYGRNLFDEFHITSWNGPSFDPRSVGPVNDPREMGIGLSAAF